MPIGGEERDKKANRFHHTKLRPESIPPASRISTIFGKQKVTDIPTNLCK
jgi:hypothetical protein